MCSIKKILVVEDEANVRKLVTINLTSRGYQVLQAENGKEALGHLRNEKPAVMILDIKLPDLSGWEILDVINSDPTLTADFPVLIMTASLGDANVDVTPYPSIIGIMIKPFKTERLISTIQRILEQ
jgi:DNA-binding response OmpR family regulator